MHSVMSRPTSNPAEIRRWAQANRAMPAEILPNKVNGEPAVLHFFIPCGSGTLKQESAAAELDAEMKQQPRLRIIDWEHFFAGLEAYGLVVSYEILPGGEPGRVFEILEAEGGTPYAAYLDHN